MKYEIKYRPSYSLLEVNLDPQEFIVAEAGSLTYMDSSVQIRTHMRSGQGVEGFLKTLGVSVLGQQSFFVNDLYTNTGGKVGLVSAPIGDIQTLEIRPGRGFVVQKSAYIASSPGVDLDVQWQGFTKGIFGQGLFMLKVSGQGDLFMNTFGAIDHHSLQTGENLIVDNFHLVAFSDSCQYIVKRIGGWKETILSGEGLVVEIAGPGDVYIQTKNLREFADWLWTVLAPKVRAMTGARQ
jgi:uncharacterized protein (TIGR00266 family)